MLLLERFHFWIFLFSCIGFAAKSVIFAMAERFSVEGLANEWEGFDNIRTRLRAEEGRLVIQNEDQTYDPNNRLAILNSDILAPMLVRMTLYKLKIPDIEPLRSAVQQVYQLVSKEPSDSQIDDEGWALRHLVGHVKRKTQKQLVSLDPGNLHNIRGCFVESRQSMRSSSWANLGTGFPRHVPDFEPRPRGCL